MDKKLLRLLITCITCDFFFFSGLLSPTLLCLKSLYLWQWVSSKVWMRPSNLLLKLQRCPDWTSIAELQNAKTSQIPGPKTFWVLGDLDRNLSFCSCGKNIKLSKGDLLGTSVLSSKEGCEMDGAVSVSPATLSQSNMGRATKFVLECLRCNQQ